MARDLEVVSPPRPADAGRCSASGRFSIYVFLFAPIVLLVVFSFNANRYGTFPFTGWTTKWYGQVFGDYQIQDALTTTIRIALEVTLVEHRSSARPPRSRSCARACRSAAASGSRSSCRS